MKEIDDVKPILWLAIPINIIVVSAIIMIVFGPLIVARATQNWLWYLGFIPHLLVIAFWIIAAVVHRKTRQLINQYDYDNTY